MLQCNLARLNVFFSEKQFIIDINRNDTEPVLWLKAHCLTILLLTSDQMKYNKSWIINCFSILSSNIEHTISIPMRVDFLNHSLNILGDDVNEFIYLTPETYVLQSTLHLGILSFDSCHHGKWVMSFNDEPSALDFIETLRKNDIKVIDIQKLLSERVQMEDAIIKTVTDVNFPNFVAEVEYNMKNKNV